MLEMEWNVLLLFSWYQQGAVASSLLRSSEIKAFDLSAPTRLRKRNFPEIKNLSIAEFERNFRRFRLLFRPEDLRY